MKKKRIANYKHRCIHVSLAKVNQFTMRPKRYLDTDYNGDIDNTKRISISDDPKHALRAIINIYTLEGARLDKKAFLDFDVYEVETKPTDAIITNAELTRNKKVFDIELTREAWLITDREYTLTRIGTIRVSTALIDREIISYNLFGIKGNKDLEVVPTGVKFISVRSPIKGRPHALVPNTGFTGRAHKPKLIKRPVSWDTNKPIYTILIKGKPILGHEGNLIVCIENPEKNINIFANAYSLVTNHLFGLEINRLKNKNIVIEIAQILTSDKIKILDEVDHAYYGTYRVKLKDEFEVLNTIKYKVDNNPYRRYSSFEFGILPELKKIGKNTFIDDPVIVTKDI